MIGHADMGFTVTELNVALRRSRDFEEYVKLLHTMDRIASMMSINLIATTSDANHRGISADRYGFVLEVPRNYLTNYAWARVAGRRSIAYVSAPPSGPAPDAF